MAIVVDVHRSREGGSYSCTVRSSQNVLACLSRHRISNLVIGFMRLSKALFSIAQDILDWYVVYCFQ